MFLSLAIFTTCLPNHKCFLVKHSLFQLIIKHKITDENESAKGSIQRTRSAGQDHTKCIMNYDNLSATIEEHCINPEKHKTFASVASLLLDRYEEMDDWLLRLRATLAPKYNIIILDSVVYGSSQPCSHSRVTGKFFSSGI